MPNPKPTLQLRHREPFALTAEQFHDLALMPAPTRRAHLGWLASAWEWEQFRRDTTGGAPWLMSRENESHFATTRWPRVAAERQAEAEQVFDRMAAEREAA